MYDKKPFDRMMHEKYLKNLPLENIEIK